MRFDNLFPRHLMVLMAAEREDMSLVARVPWTAFDTLQTRGLLTRDNRITREGRAMLVAMRAEQMWHDEIDRVETAFADQEAQRRKSARRR